MSTDGKMLPAPAGRDLNPLTLDAFQPLADIELTVFAIIDRRTISVSELLQLEAGHLLPLRRPAGENIDLFAGDVCIGSAEILVTDEKVAVRVAELCDKPVPHAAEK